MTHRIHPGADRQVVREPDRVTRHSFSFGSHYDPTNLGFGPMVAHFDDVLAPDGGYAEHPHSDLEIVTWVLEGAVRHVDSTGATTLVEPGTVQVMSAGSGIRHSELADAASGPTRFVQVWVRPDEAGTPPWHVTAAAAPALDRGGLVPLVSGHRDDALARIGTHGATLYAATLTAGESVVLPVDPRQHLYIARGSIALEGEVTHLDAGDAVRITDEPGRRVIASMPTELLLWSFRS